AFLQAILFGVQLQFMRKSMTDTATAATAAKDAAMAAQKQASVAERTLTDLERPYIFIFGLSRIRRNNSEFYISYNVANYGKTSAIVDEARIAFVTWENQGVELPPEMGEDHTLVASSILAAGEVRESILEYVPPEMLRDELEIEYEGGIQV